MLAVLAAASCAAPPTPSTASAKHLLLVTIDTIRADRVGAYGDASARTPNIDALASRGVRFDRAFATAPITLPSHASMLTGLYPPGHGSRHNGLRVDAKVPTLATALSEAGFSTGAFIAAFPLDRRFGLNRGFAVYDDVMPRGERGGPRNERSGRVVVDHAVAWMDKHRSQRMFLWVHLFEPHAPYGDARDGRPAVDRYRDDITEADAQIGRLLTALGPDAAHTVVIVAGDHGEAFGEHGEVSHSIFVYDTTLRVPFVVAGPAVPAAVVSEAVSLIDLAPTALTLLGVRPFDSDGASLAPGFSPPPRELYAESYAPMLDFGWSPLRSVRAGDLKYIAAPREELYNVARDAGELHDLARTDAAAAASLRSHVNRYGSDAIAPTAMDADARARLQALGYVGGSGTTSTRADPKDRRALARSLAQAMSGEIHGAALETALIAVLKEDRNNAQAHLRLGHLLVESNRCAVAIRHLKAAIAAGLPGADPYIDLAYCQVQAGQLDPAVATLRDAMRAEPDNPVVLANLGMLLSDAGRHAEGVAPLRRALEIDPDLHEARFNLVRVLARDGRKDEARREADELLKRLPANAPQMGEVLRLIEALR
jgi:arylsulfatase A-like enzyme/Flp pilus assembly protein TadD